LKNKPRKAGFVLPNLLVYAALSALHSQMKQKQACLSRFIMRLYVCKIEKLGEKK